MSDREKLVELLGGYKKGDYIEARFDSVIESLISNGVTVQDNNTAVRTIPLDEIYRVIAGHSNYHGDDILSALSCIAEGKEVKPVRPLEQER